MEEKRYSKLMLERIAIGEIEMPEELAEDELVHRRLEEISESNAEILNDYPAAEMAERIESRLTATDATGDEDPDVSAMFGRRRSSPGIRAIALVAAAVLVLFVGIVPRLLDRSDTGTTGSIRLKGQDSSVIRIYRQAGVDAELLDDASLVRENDVLQISYSARQSQYGTILSLDGRGVVTVHYPYDSSTAGLLDTGGEVALDYAYRLDDAPEFERFFLLTSDESFSVSSVVSAIKTLSLEASGGKRGSAPVPEGIEQYSMTLLKETTR